MRKCREMVPLIFAMLIVLLSRKNITSPVDFRLLPLTSLPVVVPLARRVLLIRTGNECVPWQLSHLLLRTDIIV